MAMKEIDRELFVSLNEENHMYYILNDGNFVDKYFAPSTDKAIEEFRDRLAKHELERDTKVIQSVYRRYKLDVNQDKFRFISSVNGIKKGFNMWYVYNKQDSWECGWTVASEAEAKKKCAENEELTYTYVGGM